MSDWPRYARGRPWWPDRLAARLMASTTPGPQADAAAETPSAPHADLGARAAAKPRFSGRSIAWPIAAAAAFTLALFLFDSLRIPLFWDESVYASQISQHVPMPWGAERARGLPLLVAPVPLLPPTAPLPRTSVLP